MIGMRWAIRSVGLVSTVILARILTPEDFGIVAMSSLVIGLLHVCADMGTGQVLLRMGETDRKAYDTAWTIGVIVSISMAVIVCFMAYPAAAYFKEPRLVAVMQVVAAGSVLYGFSNIGVIMFRRDLDFRRDFLFGFYAKVLSVIPTIILAVIYRHYWALVAGSIIGGLLNTAVSYAMHPYRPRFCLAAWRHFVSYSLWITPSNVADFFNQKIDVFVVGYLATTAQMGAYNVASELSRTATTEIVLPMARAIYPNYAKLKDNLKELTDAFLIVVRTVGIISFSCGFGIAAVAEDVVYVILGDQWGFAVPLVAWLGIFSAFCALQFTVAYHIYIVLQMERTVFFINWLRLAVFGSSVLLAAHFGGVVDIAMAAALSTAAFTVACLFYLPTALPVSVARVIAEIFRVFLTAVVMFIAVKLLHSYEIQSRFVTLMIDAATGAAVFGVILYVSWIAAGRPDGPEKRLASLLAGRFGTLTRRG